VDNVTRSPVQERDDSSSNESSVSGEPKSERPYVILAVSESDDDIGNLATSVQLRFQEIFHLRYKPEGQLNGGSRTINAMSAALPSNG
jgi:hypothetical protein